MFLLYFNLLPILLFFILIIILLKIFKFKNLKIINYIYLFKFFVFNIFLIFYYIFYFCLYIVFFSFKNFRFYKYYFRNMNTALFYYTKKSIYFLFWRYLVHFIIYIFLISIKYILQRIIIYFKNIFYINNIFIFLIIYLKIIYNINYFYLKQISIYIYNIYIYIIYHLFNFLNIDEIFLFIKKFNFNFLNIFNYIKDPILYRNINFTFFYDKIFKIYKEINQKILFYFFYNSIINFNIILKFIIGFFLVKINTVNWFLYSYNDKNKMYMYTLSYIFLISKIKFNIFKFIFNYLKIFIYFINIFLINIIYIIITYLTYIINISFVFIIKIRKILLFIIIFFFCFKYYWIIYYYIFLLYKHYLLYVPLFNVKESIRFFNFEWVDLRNYFNLIFLHNTLVDLSHFNNMIYNDLLNNLNKTLSIYGFKIGDQFDINLYSLINMQNKDTELLHNLFNVYNQSYSYSLLKWYTRLKKLFTNKAHTHFKFTKKAYKNSYHKPFEKTLRYNSIKEENASYLSLHREYLLKNNYKHKLVIWKHFNKNYFKKFPRNYISLNIAIIPKIKKIPLKYIYLYNTDNYTTWHDNAVEYSKASNNILSLYAKMESLSYYLLLRFKKFWESPNYNFFFGRIYNFENYKNNFYMKHKIPTFEWTALRWNRKTSNPLYYNPAHVLQLEENQKWYSFYDLAKQKMKKKRVYRSFYLTKKYPFYLNKNNIQESLIYLNQLPSYLKIIKKYYYLQNAKIYYIRRLYKKLLNSNKLFIELYIYRLKNWNDPFIKKQLNHMDINKKELVDVNIKFPHLKKERNIKIYNKDQNQNELNFWSFFDYFKVDKYYFEKHKDVYQEESDYNLYFIKKARKDYLKLRNNLIRMYSLFFNYYILERTYYREHFPLPDFFLRTILSSVQQKRLLVDYESFKLNWVLKIYLTKDRVNVEYFTNIWVLSKLFKQHFFSYFVYCDYTINSYNELYYIKIKSYKLKVLNKINNLKRFFYFKNKHIGGWSLFKYINSLSLQYHIKHFLWNSPYSFILFQNNFINNKITDGNLINNFNFEYQKVIKNEIQIIKFNNYSMIFNLYLNVIELKYNWYDLFIFKNDNNFIFLCDITFKNYYHCGYSIFKPLHIIDLYRFTMNFLFEYYLNFLLKLTRYRYVLDYKNYTLYEFIQRYFNFNTKLHMYIKIKFWIQDFKILHRFYLYLITPKNKYAHNAYKKQFLPLWFFFDYYIKLFIYFLLNKYYIKEFFIYYWIYFYKEFFILNSNLIFFTILYYYIKYLLYQYFNYSINLNINFNIYIFFNIFIIKNIYNYFVIFFWYLSMIFQFNRHYILFMDFLKIKFLFKMSILNLNKLDIYKYNLNKIILIKLYLEKMIFYYIKNILNIKNNLIFFKPNYIYYRKQRGFRHVNTLKLNNTIFRNTITYRNRNSFRHLTNNVLFFKNIYLTNIYNYIYLINITKINLENCSDLFFYIFKYNYMYFNMIIYILIYIFIFIFLFFFNKKCYHLFFFCFFEDSNYKYNWDKMVNPKVIILSKNYNIKKKKYNLLNKKYSFYDYLFFNNFFRNISYFEKLKHQIIFSWYKKNNEKHWNSNNLLYIPNKKKLFIWPTLFLNKYLYNLFYKIAKMPIVLRKENKDYNFYFYDFFNMNLFNFCIFYWFMLIPYFFFEYILIKYHLKGHILIKRRIFLLLKIFLDNFRWFIKLFKLIGDGVNIILKHRNPKTYKGIYFEKNKKKLKHGYFLKWDRLHQQRLKLSPLGSYYYWFFRINKKEYLFSILKYFFNTSVKSNYFYFIYLYMLFNIIYIKKYINKNNIKLKNFIFMKYKI